MSASEKRKRNVASGLPPHSLDAQLNAHALTQLLGQVFIGLRGAREGRCPVAWRDDRPMDHLRIATAGDEVCDDHVGARGKRRRQLEAACGSLRVLVREVTGDRGR